MKRQLLRTAPVLAVALALVVGAGCSGTTALEEIPAGSQVTIETDDGRVISGKLVEVEVDAVVVEETEAGTREEVPRERIADVELKTAVEQAEDTSLLGAVLAPEPKTVAVTLPAGTVLEVALETPLASNTSRVEDQVRARVQTPLNVDGHLAVPAGSVLRGEVVEALASGKVEGRARLSLRFDELEVRGTTHPVRTAAIAYQAEGTKKDDAKKIGIGAAAGAVVGGIVGGKKGAAIGSAVGGGAGTAVVLTTPGKEVTLSSGARLSVTLQEALTIDVPRETT